MEHSSSYFQEPGTGNLIFAQSSPDTAILLSHVLVVSIEISADFSNQDRKLRPLPNQPRACPSRESTSWEIVGLEVLLPKMAIQADPDLMAECRYPEYL